MILVDANVLLYAYHPRAEQHGRCRDWVEGAFSGPMPVRLPWSTILAFLRICTHPRVFDQPLSMTEAASIVGSWLAAPAVDTIEPGERYWEILCQLLTKAQVSGALVSDAALAALAVEHGATLCTTDRDFARFSGVRTFSPLGE